MYWWSIQCMWNKNDLNDLTTVNYIYMLLIYCITSININVLVKFNVHIHVIKQNYDIGNPGVLHVLEYLTFL